MYMYVHVGKVPKLTNVINNSIDPWSLEFKQDAILCNISHFYAARYQVHNADLVHL